MLRRDDLPLNVVVIFLSVKLVQQDISVTFCHLFHALFAPQAMSMRQRARPPVIFVALVNTWM